MQQYGSCDNNFKRLYSYLKVDEKNLEVLLSDIQEKRREKYDDIVKGTLQKVAKVYKSLNCAFVKNYFGKKNKGKTS